MKAGAKARAKARACLIDIDGTVRDGMVVVPGAAAALGALRRAGIPYRLATNTTRMPRSAIVRELAAMGIAAAAADVVTAARAAAAWLGARGARRVALLIAPATREEFAGLEEEDERPEFVVVGDLGEAWTFARLNAGFRALQGGAQLVALQRNRWWDAGAGPQLDAGAFVAALEYASGQMAVLVGKPDPAFFEAAVAGLGVPIGEVAVVGDDPESDIAGAQAAGAIAVAVRTGKGRTAGFAGADAVLGSIADLPRWLGIG